MTTTSTPTTRPADRTWARALGDLLDAAAEAPHGSGAALGRAVLSLEAAAGTGLGQVCGDPAVVLVRRLARAARRLPPHALSVDQLRRHRSSLQGRSDSRLAPCPALAAPATTTPVVELVAC